VVRQGIAYVAAERELFPQLTVLENLELGAYARPDGLRERLAAVFDLFPRLAERKSQRAGTLSGGEQQMLAIARALMGRPKLLLLDEPSTGGRRRPRSRRRRRAARTVVLLRLVQAARRSTPQRQVPDRRPQSHTRRS
jgi:branched-chain amino acid transport system ATP-binding protein